jgi:proteasome accessory factor A
MGLETEYGISVPGHPDVNHMTASTRIVTAYAHAHRAALRWDYEEERPLRDARGFDLTREGADPALLTDEDAGLANLVLTNGARLYVDHAHPEYSTPEVTGPLDAVRWDKAGEIVMAEAAAAVLASGGPAIHLYKNNTDNKGASYGTHENYLMKRATPFADIVRVLTPFMVTRQVFAGAGRVGVGQDGSRHAFQLSQRADFFETEVGLETTLKRPLINTRDEPHADPEKYRRLHVIVGDANQCEVASFLKMGTTALVLTLIEEGFFSADVMLANPVQEIHRVSHDPSLRHPLELVSGRTATALQIQLEYLEQATKYLTERYGNDVDPETAAVVSTWESVLAKLEDDPDQLVDELDWVAKKSILDGYRRRDDLDWSHSRLHAVDLQWADVRPEKGLYHRLAARGRVRRLLDDDAITAAVSSPPEDTRAYFRGRCVAQYGPAVTAASWDSVIFDVPGQPALQRIATLEPLKGTKAHVAAILDTSPDISDLVAALTG